MSTLKVVDVNEAVEQEPIQNEAESPQEEELDPIPEEPTNNISNEITPEDTSNVNNNEEEKPKEPEPKKVRELDKKVKCKKCDKEMTLKTYRYTHEKMCRGKLENKPVKPQASEAQTQSDAYA